MKYLLLLLVVGYVLWRWLQGQAVRRSAPPPDPAQTIEMVACAYCGVHLPVSQALTVRSVHFCSVAHQKAHGV